MKHVGRPFEERLKECVDAIWFEIHVTVRPTRAITIERWSDIYGAMMSLVEHINDGNSVHKVIAHSKPMEQQKV